MAEETKPSVKKVKAWRATFYGNQYEEFHVVADNAEQAMEKAFKRHGNKTYSRFRMIESTVVIIQ